MNDENIKEVLKSIGAEDVPADVAKLAQVTSNNFSKSLTQEQPRPRRPILLEYIMRSRLPKLVAAAVIVIAVLVATNMFSTTSSVAWAELVERVEKIKTVAYRMNMKMKGLGNAPEGETLDIAMKAKCAYDVGIAIDMVAHADDKDVNSRAWILFDQDVVVKVN